MTDLRVLWSTCIRSVNMVWIVREARWLGSRSSVVGAQRHIVELLCTYVVEFVLVVES